MPRIQTKFGYVKKKLEEKTTTEKLKVKIFTQYTKTSHKPVKLLTSVVETEAMSAAFLRPCFVPQSNKETFQRNSLELIRFFQNTRENTRFGMKNLKTTTLAVNLPTPLLGNRVIST